MAIRHEQLDAEGLIDPHEVGIIGFSRTGWYVLNSLLHAKKYFVAATLAKCTYIGYGEYIMNADSFGQQARAKQIASALGPEPFGAGLQKWITDSAGFNTDKIDIPAFFEENSPTALVYSRPSVPFSGKLFAVTKVKGSPTSIRLTNLARALHLRYWNYLVRINYLVPIHGGKTPCLTPIHPE